MAVRFTEELERKRNCVLENLFLINYTATSSAQDVLNLNKKYQYVTAFDILLLCRELPAIVTFLIFIGKSLHLRNSTV